MAQPNKREEKDIDPRKGKHQGNPLENANPTARNFQQPSSDNNKITDNKNRNKKTGSEHYDEDYEDTSGSA